MMEQKFIPQWYTIPELAEIVPVNLYQKEQKAAGKPYPGFQNLHVLCRAEFDAGLCRDEKSRVILQITADDYYKAYVNGHFAGQGPAPAYPEKYYYNEIDITEQTRPGKNLLAVHAYYQGVVNRVWNSGDGRFAVAARIVTVQKQGIQVCEPKWEYQVSHAYSGETTGYDTQFLENFDSRLWDENWNRLPCETSDSGPGHWEKMTSVSGEKQWKKMAPALWADYRVVPQPSKMPAVYERTPRIVEKRSDNSWFADMGQEIAGSLILRARGCSGQQVRIFCGEELQEDGSVRYDMRCGCRYAETWTLDDGECRLEQYDYKAFRYCCICADAGVELLEIKCLLRHYPFDETQCVLRTNDRALEQIFTLCKDTIHYGVQEGYLDCPSREKGQYLGDAVIAARAQVWLSGTTELLRKCIDQFAQTACICPGLMAVAPGTLMQEIADFSLLWGELLLLDYQFTRDRQFLERYYPTAKGILIYFRKYQDPDGLLSQVSEKWNLVDWPENLRDAYDFTLSRPVVAPGSHNVINALYVGAAKTLCEIEELLGYPHFIAWEPLQKAYVERFYRPEKKLFADSDTSSHTALHSNLYPLYFGIAPEESKDRIRDLIMEKGLCCGVMTSYFLLKGLARNGYYEEMYRLLTNESERGWIQMIRDGATTCLEAWGKDQKWNTSFCHPWGTAPVSIIIEEICGIRPDENAENGYRKEPHVPKGVQCDVEIRWLAHPEEKEEKKERN